MSNQKTAETEGKSIPLMNIHNRSFFWLGKGNSIKHGDVKLV